MRSKKFKIFLILFIFTFIILIFLFRKMGFFSPDDFFNYVKSYPVSGPLIFIAIFILSSVFFIPTLPLNIGAGILWGPFYGTLYSFIGSIIGVTICFILARYIAGDYFKKKINFKSWNWILNQVDKRGWKIVAFVRINPVFPTNIFSYLFGLTRVSFLTHFFISFIFLLPMTFLISSFSSSLKDILLLGSFENIMIGGFISLSSIIIYFLIKKLSSKYISNKKINNRLLKTIYEEEKVIDKNLNEI